MMERVSDYDANQPNAVIFGDSNTWVFGPAVRDWLARNTELPASQIIVKYRSGSSPAHWLEGSSKEFWTKRLPTETNKSPFALGPAVAEALSDATALVFVGLGGNMAVSNRARAQALELLDQIERKAPKARIVWRGPPPATVSKNGKMPTEATKLARYVLNNNIEQALVSRGFRVFDGVSHTQAWGAGERRVYLDLVSVHAGGPRSPAQTTIGTDKDRAWEQDILDAAPKPELIAGDIAVIGPWTSFTRARDNFKVPSHVPRAAAADLVEIIGQAGVLALGGVATVSVAPINEGALCRVIDADARIRSGPPKFRWTKRRIPVGTEVIVEAREGRNVRVTGVDGSDYQWTRAANLVAITNPQPQPSPEPPVIRPDLHTVINKRALVREGPPEFSPVEPERTLPRFSLVLVDRLDGDFAHVRNDSGELGWTAAPNLRLQFKDTGKLLAASLAPRRPVRIEGTKDERNVARTYNRLGGLIELGARELDVETDGILAVWMAETRGRAQTRGKMTIRVENHVLFNRWGKHHPTIYDLHFRHGGRNGVAGGPARKHACRPSESAIFTEFHGDQDEEYEALSIASEQAGPELARTCISMGGPQIMGFNHAALGYASAVAMYEAFQASERMQVLGFFDFVTKRRHGNECIEALRERDWLTFGRLYNGSSKYAAKLERWIPAVHGALARRA